MQEAELYQYWQHYARSRQPFSSAGHRVRVLQAGRFSSERGPDFQSACFELDGVIYQGDVEAHCRAQDWYRHQHHLDAAYANVVLHITGPENRAPQTVTSRISGRQILSLVMPVPAAPSYHPAGACQPGKSNPRQLCKALQELALQRFDFKIQQFRSACGASSEAQVFYENMMRALGYPGNSETFQLLAQRLDYGWLLFWKERFGVGFRDIYAMYAGQAGFLDETAPDDYCRDLQNRFRRFQPYLKSARLAREQWLFARNRLGNHPHFRLAAWSALLSQSRELPMAHLSKIFSQRPAFEQLYMQLQQYFSAAIPEYWRTHSALTQQRPGRPARNFFGRARFTEILINIILPFFALQAQQSQSFGFFSYLQGFYLWLPLAASYAGLEKRLPFLAGYRELWPAQALLQAFLFLESNFCQAADCQNCPLGRISDKSR
jgi:hypothetical protein